MSAGLDETPAAHAVRRLDRALTVCLVILGAALAAALVHRYLWRTPARAAPEAGLVGLNVTLPDVSWTAPRTLVLALDKDCRFCSESGPFYRRLSSEAGAVGVSVVAVLRDDPAVARDFLDGLGVSIGRVVRMPPAALGVRIVPSVLSVDASGVVQRAWVGRLTPEREAEVLSHLR